MKKEKRDWIIGLGIIAFLTVVLMWSFFSRPYLKDWEIVLAISAPVLMVFLLFYFYKHKDESKKYWLTYLRMLAALLLVMGAAVIVSIIDFFGKGYSLDSLIFGFFVFAAFSVLVWAYWKKKKPAFYLSIAIAYFVCVWSLYWFATYVLFNPWAFNQTWKIESVINALPVVLFFVFFSFKSKSEFGIKSIVPKRLGKKKFYIATALLTTLILLWFQLPTIATELAMQGNPALCGLSPRLDTCLNQAAINGKNISLCQNEWCLTSYALNNKDISACENSDFENEKIRDRCFSSYGTRYHSVEACGKIKDLISGEKNWCYTSIAIGLKDFEICNHINEPLERADCVDEINRSLGNCEEVLDSEIKDYCYYNKARYNDESLCEMIKDAEMKERCLEPPGLI